MPIGHQPTQCNTVSSEGFSALEKSAVTCLQRLCWIFAVLPFTVERVLQSSPNVHCKKELAVFPSPAGMSLIKLFLGGDNLVFSRPERVWSVTSRLGTGKWLTLFYSVFSAISSDSSYSKQYLPVNNTQSLCLLVTPRNKWYKDKESLQ